MWCLVLFASSMILSQGWANPCFWGNCYCFSGKMHQMIFCFCSLINEFRGFQNNRKDSTMTYDDALKYAIGLLIFSGMQTISSNHFFMIGSHNGMKVRIAVCSLIYRKVRESCSNANTTESISNEYFFFILHGNSRFGYHKLRWAKQLLAKL